MTATLSPTKPNLSLAYNVHIAKIYFLLLWVHEHIEENPGDFISTSELYFYYKADKEKINPIFILPELSFYREI